MVKTIIGGIAAIAIALVGAPVAQADDQTYLDALSSRGFQVMGQSTPFLLAAGNQMCNEMRGGATPEDIAGRWFYPNATHQNLLDMRRRLRPSCARSRSHKEKA